MSEEKVVEPGVVYLSRVPPFMTPFEVRQRLSAFGTVTRIFLRPEDQAVARKRKKFKGVSKQNFTDGWVEFQKKKDAKYVAEMLNGQPLGGKKRSQYRDDLWTIKYLKGFKWAQLTEEIGELSEFFFNESDFFASV
jgi:ESF2/ABP1 family protein